MTDTLTHFIGGERVKADTPHESLNPSDTREIVARFPDGGKADVDAAVDAARKGLPGLVRRIARSPRRPARQGRRDHPSAPRRSRKTVVARRRARRCPKASARSPAPAASSNISPAKRCAATARISTSVRPGVEINTFREAVGVFGLITPWNFPIAIPAWKTAPALAFGNTVVIKPAGPTPATAAALADIIFEAGAPAGVFNMVIGRGGVG